MTSSSEPTKLTLGTGETIEVKLADGSIWVASMSSGGDFYLMRQVVAPPPPTLSYTSPVGIFDEAPVAMFAPTMKPTEPLPASALPTYLKHLEDKVFRERLRSIMLDNKYDRRLKGRTRGKLDMTRLYKVPTNSRSVFTQKQSRKGKQYNIVLVVDESGSMISNNKSRHAADCAVFLAKAFEGLNLNLAVIGFNSYITIRKEFTTKADYKKLHEDIATMNHSQGRGYNYDYQALQRGYKLLERTAPKGHNLLLMLSDGAPAPNSVAPIYINIHGKQEKPLGEYVDNPLEHYKGGRAIHPGQQAHFHHLVSANKKLAASIGIGILEGGWQVPNHVVVKDVNELKPAVLTALRKVIRRG